jgi:hypothetical protein
MNAVWTGHGIGTMELKFGDDGSHSLKSPVRSRAEGVPALMTEPWRIRRHSSSQKKNVFDLSVL